MVNTILSGQLICKSAFDLQSQNAIIFATMTSPKIYLLLALFLIPSSFQSEAIHGLKAVTCYYCMVEKMLHMENESEIPHRTALLGTAKNAGLVRGNPRKLEHTQEGQGIATKYPNDKGIEKDPDIVLAENFEDGDYKKRWDDVKNPKCLELCEDPKNVHSGKHSIQITATLGDNTGGHLYKMLSKGLDTCYLRFYAKFEKEHEYVHHFVHLTAYNPGTKWPQGGAGELPDGSKRATTGIEPWGNWGRHKPPGAWNFYTYWCEMKKSKDGKYWGNSFAPEEPVLVERDKWICVEMMMKMNSSPDKEDGEQAFWIDGKCAGRWGGFRWRTLEELKINGIWILYYITENAPKQNNVKDPKKVNRIWFDDILVAKSYIGPLCKEKQKN